MRDTPTGGVARPRAVLDRRKLRAIAVLALLAVLAVFVWIHLAHRSTASARGVTCPAPTSAAGAAQPLARNALHAVAPLPPPQVHVHVFNGSTQRGFGARGAAELRTLGFTVQGVPGNDPHYPNGALNCYGQIRFGASGAPAARTLSFVVPCAQLVRDNRADSSVDLSLGATLTYLDPRSAARTALHRLSAGGGSAPVGGTLAHGSDGPTLNASLLRRAHAATC
ncbi:MAG: envelope integrity protein Cei [Sciscionella sp.]